MHFEHGKSLFGTLAKNANVISFHKHLGSKKYVIEFKKGQAICIPYFMTIAQTDQNLGREDDSSPPGCGWSKKPGSKRVTRTVYNRLRIAGETSSTYEILFFWESLDLCLHQI